MSDKKDEKKDPAAPAGEEVAEQPKKKKLLIMGGVGLLVVLLGAGGAFFFLSKGSKKAAAQNPPETHGEQATAEADGEAKKDDGHGDAKKDDGHGDAKKDDGHGDAKKDDGHGEAKKGDGKGDGKKEKTDTAASNYGQTFPLKPFHMNLGNPLENRYLRLEVTLEYRGGEPQKTELDSRVPQIRDIVVSTSSRKTMEFLLGPDGKDQLRYEIFTRLNQVLDKKVEAVYITDILVE